MWKSTPINEILRITEIYTYFTAKRSVGFISPIESHDFWECVYVIKGSIKETAGEQTYILNPGDMIFHKPLEVHKLSVTGGKDASLLIFSFSMQGDICGFFENKVLTLGFSHTEAINGMLKIIDTYYPTSTPAWPSDLAPETIQLMAEYIKILFILLYNDHKKVSASESKDAVMFRDVVLYLKQNIDKTITIKDISEKFFMSETNVKRLFKSCCGIGAHAYFLKLKLSTSAEMLRCGKSINEVSEELGFCDSGYFSTVFKREMGMAPTAYKRMHAERQ